MVAEGQVLDDRLQLLLTLRQASGTRTFWLLLLAVVGSTAPAQGFLRPLTPLVIDGGFSTANAALFLSLYSTAVVIERVGTGILLDRLLPYQVALQ